LFKQYQKIIRQYKKLPIQCERKLIASAKKGNKLAQNELLLHLTGYFIFRIQTTLYSYVIEQYGEDILQDCFLFTTKVINSYKLGYKNKVGKIQIVHLSTYMWKGITGIILNHIKSRKEVCFSNIPKFKIEKYE
jgi:hypothetical protein